MSIITKAALIERIGRGPAAVQAIYTVTRYRVSVPGDDDPNGGVWISLSPDHRYIIEDYATAHAWVAGREVRLTQREANEIARLIARTMRLRARPWQHAQRPPKRRRRA
ncbi:MAG TPA: hypothetical protein VJ276_17905 [Thermoanaerobaculia bacterium]|nr:hypothetical protein [Thermoanaerobaculia bacterium]